MEGLWSRVGVLGGHEIMSPGQGQAWLGLLEVSFLAH